MVLGTHPGRATEAFVYMTLANLLSSEVDTLHRHPTINGRKRYLNIEAFKHDIHPQYPCFSIEANRIIVATRADILDVSRFLPSSAPITHLKTLLCQTERKQTVRTSCKRQPETSFTHTPLFNGQNKVISKRPRFYPVLGYVSSRGHVLYQALF